MDMESAIHAVEDEKFDISDEPTLTKLREEAKALKIKGYSKMSKEELEEKIKEKEQETEQED